MGDILKEAILEARKARQIAFNNAKEALIESLSPKLENVINRKINSTLNEEAGVDDIRYGKGKGGWANPNDTDEEGYVSGDEAGEVKKSNDPLKEEEEEITEDDDEIDFDVEGSDEDQFGYEDPDLPGGGDPSNEFGGGEDEFNFGGGGNEMPGGGGDMNMHNPDDIDINVPPGRDVGGIDLDGEDSDIELELDDDLNFSGLQQEEYDDGDEYDKKIDMRSEGKRIRQRRGNDGKKLNESVKAKVNKIVSDNQELKKANHVLITELRKSNLFNAKLTYTFRILENHKLTPDQKKRVVETMDKAKTVREASLIHKTIRESLKITESKKKNNIQESASRPVGKAADLLLTEENDMKERWARIAGIKR